MTNMSLAQIAASMPLEEREDWFKTLSTAEAEALLSDWRFWARPNQLAPDDEGWNTWLIQAGRGFGKTRAGAE